MFELPVGTPVNESIELIEGHLQPFAHGAISTYVGRRKKPVGHRLVRGGRIVAWMIEENGVMLGGGEAKAALEALEADQKVRLLATSYSIKGLGSLAEILPETFEHQADRQGLKSASNIIERLLSRDLSTVIREMAAHTTVRGALAIDSGMLIDQADRLHGR